VSDVSHIDVAAYAAGLLDRPDARAFEEHLAGCEACRREHRELESLAAVLAIMPDELPEPPPGLEALSLLAVERAAVQPAPRRRTRTRLSWRPALAFSLACVAAVGLGLATMRDREPPLEVVATLRGDAGAATIEVVKTGIGRVVRFDTADLPILPRGEYYELWWVGPGDRRGRPKRISAGTFHPDDRGVSQVTFAAAVDPAKYPRLAVTAEPGDGDPSPQGPDLLRGRVRPPR
jgi:anti-sigma-K factor RskA